LRLSRELILAPRDFVRSPDVGFVEIAGAPEACRGAVPATVGDVLLLPIGPGGDITLY